MDDVDHSIKISDHDWLSFFEDSEECCLLQASLACPDSSGLSDADEPDFTTQTYAPINQYQPGEDSKKPGVVEEQSSAVQCSSEMDRKGESDLKSESRDTHGNDCVTCAEKESWFVSVNDKPHQQLVPVVKRKRKQKKICKVDCTKKEKANTGNISNTGSLETGVNTTYLQYYSKEHSQFDKESAKTVKSSDTTSTQEVCCEYTKIQLNTGLECVGVPSENSIFTLQNATEPKEIKCDTKYRNTLNTGFIHGNDQDVSSDSTQTEPTMALTNLYDSSIDDLDASNLTKVRSNICVNKSFQIEVNLEMICSKEIDDEDKLKDIVVKNTKIDISNNLDAINQTRNVDIQEECLKKKNLTCFGASCNEQSLNVNLIRVESGISSGKSADNPVTSHTNSTESDEFADYESFSSSSYDSETYHSAAESVEDPRHLSKQNSPCNLSISISNDTDREIHFTDTGVKQDCSQSPLETSQTSTEPTDDNLLGSLDDQPESLPQLDITMESPEAFAKATGNTQPVYAISAFWDEMEKLTINDILQIRTGRCMLPIEEVTEDAVSKCTNYALSINLPENAFLDKLDMADSDYCTNLDESKPDRSSCDFSTSDFEEEYWQFIYSSRNSSPDQKDLSECTDYVSTDQELDEMGTPVPSEGCPEQSSSCNATVNSYDLAMPQQMRKNKSMYDIHASLSMEDLSSQAFWDLSSCKSLEEPLKMSDGFEVVTPIMCLTDEQYQISFPKVFEYLFDYNKTKCEAMSVSVYGLQGNYATPMNNYTFCTATNDLSLVPYNGEPIPIFSCSRPTVRELTFPKPGSIFFGRNYTTMKDFSPIQIVSQSILTEMHCKEIDRSYSFSHDLTSLYSVKEVCFLDKESDVFRYQVEDEEKPVDETDSNMVNMVGEGGFSISPKMFKETTIGQISMEKDQARSDIQSIFSTIKQSDMCLVCIAFASWVLKSSDPKSADAWKAALLANVSALSAIQYLRQYMKKKTSPQDE